MNERPASCPINLDQKDGDNYREWVKNRGGEVLSEPYHRAIQELKELSEKFNYSDDQLDSEMHLALTSFRKSDLGTEDVTAFLYQTNLLNDLKTFKARVCKAYEENLEDNSANWFFFEKSKKLIKYVSLEGHRALQDSRSIGLRPLMVTDKLRDIKIKSMGLSAVAPTLDLLVAAGVENITAYDGGIEDPSNLPRYVGSMARLDSIGLAKAEMLSETLYMRNPYGNYDLVCGKVVENKEDIKDVGDVCFEEFFHGVDMVLEVVDDVYLKSKVDLWLRKNGRQVPIMFLADLSLPIAGISLSGDSDHFNQGFGVDKQREMANRNSGVHPLNLVSGMIGHDLPNDHLMQFLTMKHGLMPYWSQLPESSRELSALSVLLVEAFLAGKKVLGRNYNIKTVPRNLMADWTEEQEKILEIIKQQNFGF